MGDRPERGTATRLWVGALSLAVVVGVAFVIWHQARGGAAPAAAFSPDVEATRSWLDAPPPSPLPSCDEREPPEAPDELVIGVAVFIGPGVDEAMVRRELGGLRDAFLPWNVGFEMDGPPHPLAMREAATPMLDPIPADEPPSGSEERRDMWRALLGPALDFVAEQSVPPRGAINLVFVERIAPARSALRRLLPHLDGLTFAPHEREEPDVLQLIGASDFAPTVFVSSRDVQDRSGDATAFTLAHEVGHALGLSHVDEPANLMSPGPHTCVPVLDDRQRAALRPPPR